MRSTRPTLRCLRDDLHLPLPAVTTPLDEIDHPLITKAVTKFADPGATHERIRAIDDHVFLKVKVQRWRGAAWISPDEDQPWLVAAGRREDGSLEDFYQVLANTAEAARARHNATHTPALNTNTYTDEWLPTANDQDRYVAESGIRMVRQLRATVRQLARASLLDGHEHTEDLLGARLGIQVRADEGHETYVAIRITGSVSEGLVMAVLRVVPGCDPEAWYPEIVHPSRPVASNEQIWSNLMDPNAAATLLGEE